MPFEVLDDHELLVCITIRVHLTAVDCCFILHPAIEIGFTRERIYLTEEFRYFGTVINRSRVSEQTFLTQVESTTFLSNVGERAILGLDFDVPRRRRYYELHALESSIYLSALLLDD